MVVSARALWAARCTAHHSDGGLLQPYAVLFVSNTTAPAGHRFLRAPLTVRNPPTIRARRYDSKSGARRSRPFMTLVVALASVAGVIVALATIVVTLRGLRDQ